eukprot:scaffold803_cov310-Pinguiococcus_pyrenoidosus.AAC.74
MSSTTCFPSAGETHKVVLHSSSQSMQFPKCSSIGLLHKHTSFHELVVVDEGQQLLCKGAGIARKAPRPLLPRPLLPRPLLPRPLLPKMQRRDLPRMKATTTSIERYCIQPSKSTSLICDTGSVAERSPVDGLLSKRRMPQQVGGCIHHRQVPCRVRLHDPRDARLLRRRDPGRVKQGFVLVRPLEAPSHVQGVRLPQAKVAIHSQPRAGHPSRRLYEGRRLEDHPRTGRQGALKESDHLHPAKLLLPGKRKLQVELDGLAESVPIVVPLPTLQQAGPGLVRQQRCNGVAAAVGKAEVLATPEAPAHQEHLIGVGHPRLLAVGVLPQPKLLGGAVGNEERGQQQQRQGREAEEAGQGADRRDIAPPQGLPEHLDRRHTPAKSAMQSRKWREKRRGGESKNKFKFGNCLNTIPWLFENPLGLRTDGHSAGMAVAVVTDVQNKNMAAE